MAKAFGPTHHHRPRRIAHRPVSGVGNDAEDGAVSESDADGKLHDHMERAAEVLAHALRDAAAPITRTTAESTEVAYVAKDGSSARVRAGGDSTPAIFFDPEYKIPSRHPLFGDRKHFYDQPYRPFGEEAVERSADRIAEEMADGWEAVADEIGSDRPES